jgi:UDP-N-acetylmuramoyl-tripeptide--D-alanyl-D-alanine ligase
MFVAIENFPQLDNANKVMILWDMFEPWGRKFQEHKAIAANVVKGWKCSVICWSAFYENKIEKDNFLHTLKVFPNDLSEMKLIIVLF